MNKVKIVLQHYEFGMPIIDSLKASKFKIIDEFADSLMYHHDKNSDENQDFLFTINMESFTEEAVKVTNKNGMGNKVGVITNRVTAMMEVQARFKPDSREYKELEYRISCGQLYQQDELD